MQPGPLLALLLLLLGPGVAVAGPWARGEGVTFVSVSHGASSDPTWWGTPWASVNHWTGLYVERGATRRLTLGLDAGSADFGRTLDLLLFASRALDDGSGPHRLAAEFGLGLRRDALGTRPLLRPGLSWGRGFESGWGAGWASVVVQAVHEPMLAETDWKLDTTLGIKPDPRWMAILQFENGLPAGGEAYVRAVPSVVRRVGPGRHVQFALTAGLAGDRSVGGKIGVWLEF